MPSRKGEGARYRDDISERDDNGGHETGRNNTRTSGSSSTQRGSNANRADGKGSRGDGSPVEHGGNGSRDAGVKSGHEFRTQQMEATQEILYRRFWKSLDIASRIGRNITAIIIQNSSSWNDREWENRNSPMGWERETSSFHSFLGTLATAYHPGDTEITDYFQQMSDDAWTPAAGLYAALRSICISRVHPGFEEQLLTVGPGLEWYDLPSK
jgi:hypothetical protein